MPAIQRPIQDQDLLDAVRSQAPGLVFEMYYTQCLAAGSFLLGHGGVAVVVDPLRDVDAYLDALAAHKLQLKAVLLTHCHADYVGGHVELAARTGCVVVAGRQAGFAHPHLRAGEGDCFALSAGYVVRVMETPGHTPGCCCYVLERDARPVLCCSGDTLFVGSCGRPDLAGAADRPDLTPALMAAHMFQSLQRLAALPPATLVLPAHGAGSPCGKALSNKSFSTVGDEVRTNPAYQHADAAAFVAWLTSAPAPPPQYFANCVQLNREGCAPLAAAIAAVPRNAAAADCLVIDLREIDTFQSGHAPGCLHMPLGLGHGVELGLGDGNFGIWLGTLVTSPRILLVVTPGSEEEALARVARVGYLDRVKGVSTELPAGRAASVARFDLAAHVAQSAKGADAKRARRDEVRFLDVRTAGEFACRKSTGGHLDGAVSFPLEGTLEAFEAKCAALDSGPQYVCLCRSGYRSLIAASALRRAGKRATDVNGGYDTARRLGAAMRFGA